jgi:RNA polymerase sigma-70 factor (ECF subfamily)
MPDQQSIVKDDELVLRAGRGDKLAYGVLYERYLDLIFRYVFYRVANREEAEDLTEQVFIKAWESLPHPDREKPIRHFKAWIYRIAHNMIVDHHRTKKEWLAFNDKTVIGKATNENPESIVAIHQENQVLAKAIAGLEPQMQQVLIHRFINGYSHAETADLIGLKENHVRVIQYRALKNLRQILNG